MTLCPTSVRRAAAPVDADRPLAAGAGDDVGLEPVAVVAVGHDDGLVHADAAVGQEQRVDRDAPRILHVGERDGRPVDLGVQELGEHRIVTLASRGTTFAVHADMSSPNEPFSPTPVIDDPAAHAPGQPPAAGLRRAGGFQRPARRPRLLRRPRPGGVLRGLPRRGNGLRHLRRRRGRRGWSGWGWRAWGHTWPTATTSRTTARGTVATTTTTSAGPTADATAAAGTRAGGGSRATGGPARRSCTTEASTSTRASPCRGRVKTSTPTGVT